MDTRVRIARAWQSPWNHTICNAGGSLTGPEEAVAGGANMVVEAEDGSRRKSMKLEVAVVAVACIIAAMVCAWVICTAM
jgi:hypothetical protein